MAGGEEEMEECDRRAIKEIEEEKYLFFVVVKLIGEREREKLQKLE